MDLMAAVRELQSQFSRYYTAAAVRRIARDANLHCVQGKLKSFQAFDGKRRISIQILEDTKQEQERKSGLCALRGRVALRKAGIHLLQKLLQPHLHMVVQRGELQPHAHAGVAGPNRTRGAHLF